MTPYRFHHTSEGPLVPPLPGYQHSLTSNLRIEPGIATAGLYITRVKIDQFRLTISTVLGHTPADYTTYLRLLSVQWIDTTGKTTNPGLAVEGDPFSPNSHHGSGKILRKINPGEEHALQQCGLVIEMILKSFEIYGASDGNRLNRKMISRFFDDGLMDLVVKESLKGFSTAALELCNPDSIESVPDLDYEVGLGILPEEEPDRAPKLVPVTSLNIELASGGKDPPAVSNSKGWKFYELPLAIIASDVRTAIRLSEGTSPRLKYPTSRLFATWPEVRYHVGGNAGSTYISGDWYDPAPDWDEYIFDIPHPPCLFRFGDSGFEGVRTTEGLLTIRSEGTCIYGDLWLSKKLKPTLLRLDGEELFPASGGETTLPFGGVTTLSYG